MKKIISAITLFSFCLIPPAIFAATYRSHLCNSDAYTCVKVMPGQTWQSMFPDESQRTIVRKANRMNTPLHAGMVIAVPKNLETISLIDIAPFPHKISSSNRGMIKVDLSDLAWGAYDSNGNLVNWGPISAGKSYCPDIRRSCRTPTGEYTVYRTQGPGCRSSRFPLPRGGAPMPYCMHFKGGYALHASGVVPGYNASHGCVRMFLEDARWLNQEFVNIGSTKVSIVP